MTAHWIPSFATPTRALRFLAPAGCLMLIGCGGGSSATSNDEPPGPPPPPPAGAFSGNYATRVTLGSNTCGPVVVQDNPTTVVHNAATGAVSFTHVGQTYDGVVAADSTFTTTPKSVNVNDGYLYTISLAGRFGVSAFEADATVDRNDQGNGTCRYVVHWAATR